MKENTMEPRDLNYNERIELLRMSRRKTQEHLREKRNDPTLHVHIRGADPRLTCDECANLTDEELAERVKTAILVDVAI
jgi:hypothetical protein